MYKHDVRKVAQDYCTGTQQRTVKMPKHDRGNTLYKMSITSEIGPKQDPEHTEEVTCASTNGILFRQQAVYLYVEEVPDL